jgi:hypothetical protein
MEGTALDSNLANFKVRQWIRAVANQRLLRDLKQSPHSRFEMERPFLLKLPPPYLGEVRTAKPLEKETKAIAKKKAMALPKQHALSVYDQLLEVA